jgi:hypothetical protein
MNATAIGVPELTCQLLDAADGIPADVAAAGLIISHGHFLHPDAFRRTITAGTSISTGQPLAATSWDAALHALESGLLPCASSEQAIQCTAHNEPVCAKTATFPTAEQMRQIRR